MNGKGKDMKDRDVIWGKWRSVPGGKQVSFSTNHSNFWRVCTVMGLSLSLSISLSHNRIILFCCTTSDWIRNETNVFTCSDHRHSGPLVSCESDQDYSLLMWPLGLSLLYDFPHNPVKESVLDPSVLAFSLSLYRHLSIYIFFSSRFTSYTLTKHLLE